MSGVGGCNEHCRGTKTRTDTHIRTHMDTHVVYSVDIVELKMFLYWFKSASRLRCVRIFFPRSLGKVSVDIRKVKDSLFKGFVPYHLGFGRLHGLTFEYVRDELSTWICGEISDKIFGGLSIICAIDGTYIFCMNHGGFQGNKFLYSMHKKRLLSKVIH